jgi:hypothetical protein
MTPGFRRIRGHLLAGNDQVWRREGAGALVAARAIGSVPLPFFAENLLIFAFVGSRKRCWLCRSGLGNRA